MIYKTHGVCSKEIQLDLDGNVIKKVDFVSGCKGNLQGISKLVEGMEIDDVIEKLCGIRCGDSDTSCPDQLAKALMEYKK